MLDLYTSILCQSANINGIVFLIWNSTYLLLVYRKMFDFYVLTFYALYHVSFIYTCINMLLDIGITFYRLWDCLYICTCKMCCRIYTSATIKAPCMHVYVCTYLYPPVPPFFFYFKYKKIKEWMIEWLTMEHLTLQIQ